MTNIVEALLALRNEEYIRSKRTCLNCNEDISWVRWFSDNCPKADQLQGLAHVFALHPNGRGRQDLPEPITGVCIECEEYQPDDSRVAQRMRCHKCAGYGA